jgi:hypothetical protein
MWVAADLLCLYAALMKNGLSRASDPAAFEHGLICEMNLEEEKPRSRQQQTLGRPAQPAGAERRE